MNSRELIITAALISTPSPCFLCKRENTQHCPQTHCPHRDHCGSLSFRTLYRLFKTFIQIAGDNSTHMHSTENTFL